jgi:hypothetical protein
VSEWAPEDRRAFALELARAGWDVETWDGARDAGATVDLDGEAEYAGPSLRLRLELPPDSRQITLQIYRQDGELVLYLRLHAQSVSAGIAPILAAQDTLNEQNVADLVKALLAACDRVLIQTDEGVFALSQ